MGKKTVIKLSALAIGLSPDVIEGELTKVFEVEFSCCAPGHYQLYAVLKPKNKGNRKEGK